jgi:hypothetical protein
MFSRDGRTGEEDRPLLYGAELVEMPAEEDDGDPVEVTGRSRLEYASLLTPANSLPLLRVTINRVFSGRNGYSGISLIKVVCPRKQS